MRTSGRVGSVAGMRQELVPEALWARIAPLLPKHRRHRRGGRPWADDRAALRGIVFVLRTGIAWRDIPTDVFGVSGVTCWRRFNAWAKAGVFARLHQKLLDELGLKGRIDWSRASMDSSIVRAQKGGPRRGPAPSTEPSRV
jgi:transposase